MENDSNIPYPGQIVHFVSLLPDAAGQMHPVHWPAVIVSCGQAVGKTPDGPIHVEAAVLSVFTPNGVMSNINAMQSLVDKDAVGTWHFVERPSRIRLAGGNGM